MALKDLLWKPLLVSVFFLFGFAFSAHATGNDYLETLDHYTVSNAGRSALHFSVPIWVFGRANDYYLTGSNDANDSEDTYIWYSTKNNAERGDSEVIRAISIRADRDGKNVDEKSAAGEGDIRVHSNAGVIVVTSTYDGVDVQVNDDNSWKHCILKKKVDKSYDKSDYITYIEFDWYPPASLDSTDFYVGISARINQHASGHNWYVKWWQWTDKFKGGDIPQSPDLYNPYLYAVNDQGPSGYGYAAVPYVTYQEPIDYEMSTAPGTRIKCNQQAGNLLVMTSDTEQHNFSAKFMVYTNKDIGTKQQLQTNSISIPAFHRIYNFSASEVRDAKESLTGFTTLQWEVHNPDQEDLMPGDYFEIQRGTKADYSDAQTIHMEPYSADSTIYHFTDDIRDIAAIRDSVKELTFTDSLNGYDENGNLRLIMKATISADAPERGKTVYYRIRRASSSAWGWEGHDFVRQANLVKHAYLAPLAEHQPDYQLDADFENNRLVHFYFHIDNALVSEFPTPEDECEIDLKPVAIVGDMPVRIYNPHGVMLYINYRMPEETDWHFSYPGEFMAREEKDLDYCFATVPQGAIIKVTGEDFVPIGSGATAWPVIPAYGENYVAKAPVIGNVTKDEVMAAYYITDFKRGDDEALLDYFYKYSGSVDRDSVRHALYVNKVVPYFQAGDSVSRCQWDNNASLILTRRLSDMDMISETIIPQDSIVRQDDGSWIAHMTDVADVSCTHYRYTVSVDPSRATLYPKSDIEMRPININGPSLYTAEGAKISTFTATQGTDKQGVLLTWEPTPGGVSSYTLTRRDHGTDDAFKPVVETLESGYRDMKALPDKHYDYALTLSYTCHGNTTVSSDTIEGWRSPYGSIRGRITFEDGSGCAGVHVVIATNDSTVKTVITEADGSYFADSLLYEADGTDFSVTPTTTGHGEFHYNNTSDGFANVNISINRSEATGIDLVNLAAVRLTGRVLYKGTTIPVYGANFKLNGNLVSYAGSPVSTAHDGTFQMTLPKSDPITLQVVMEDHTFEGDGFLRIDGSDTIALDSPKDGVRFWDNTTIKLAGRVVGGNDQGKKPLGFGLSKNNLGDDLKIVMELEGDNISYMVHDPLDPTITQRDTSFAHLVQTQTGIDTVGTTNVTIAQKRLTIYPDPQTGEYEVDIWPVRYKIAQVTAQGYATLYGAGQGMETIILTDAVHKQIETINENDTVHYNAVYNRIYHSPIKLTLTQRNYGIDCDYFGDEEVYINSLVDSVKQKIKLVEKDEDGTIQYTFGYPVFRMATYTYRADAYEEYYYNNDKQVGARDQVNMHEGRLKVHNGMHSNDIVENYQIDANGQAFFNLVVDDPDFRLLGESALRTVSVSAEIENEFIEAEPLQALITGSRVENSSLRSSDGNIVILDVLRDPPGENSSSYLESGAKYNYSCNIGLDVKVGVTLDFKTGTNVSNNIGAWVGVGAGTYTGSDYSISRQVDWSIPIEVGFKANWNYSYNIQTNDRISTSSDNLFVGSDADVFIGLTNSILYGQARSIRVIDQATFDMRKAAYDIGTLKVLAADTMRSDGKKYYLVSGTEIVAGSELKNSFAYTQEHIIHTVLPNLIKERNSLLLNGDSAQLQKIADLQHQTVYWNQTSNPDSLGMDSTYKPIHPTDTTNFVKVDAIQNLNKIIAQWGLILINNEKQKVEARMRGRKIGTWSVSGGTTESYSESFDYSDAFTWELTGLLGVGTSAISPELFEAAEDVATVMTRIFNKTDNDGVNPLAPWQIAADAPGTKVNFSFTPTVSGSVSAPVTSGETHSKTTGFTIAPNSFGNITTSVYCVSDSAFEAESAYARGISVEDNNMEYGSFVFFTEAGATMCPHEDVEHTLFYHAGTLLNNGTLKVEDPRLEIDAHERSNVPADKPAIFNLRISNEGQVETGLGAIGTTFSLTQTASTNPNGAKIFIDGMPVTGNDMNFFLASGESVNKVMEVYRGTADDYEDIELRLGSTTCATNADYLKFSVHFLPSSSDVEISSPHDKWIMNTFSPQDSVGYYLPITIEGFDVHHRGFDHIEFQYKLSTQSDDDWVNQCSFYADKDLYDAATGNKQMITNGRINTLRFYGERDPMEQQYDLRAVTFCRHGSGFVSKSSKILTGMKDTRPPRVFGNPTPANSVLTINDVLSLRFNEAIAGNYLDEDNNFQIVGITNASGIVSSTSVNFDGTQDSYAATKILRNLSDRSFTVDVTIKPSVRGEKQVLFEHGADGERFIFGITSDNKLFASIGDKTVYSETLDPMLSFSRVLVSYDATRSQVHLYAGTQDITDGDNTLPAYNKTGMLIFGRGFKGNMLEARLWSKVLLAQEISKTNMCRLTGYERELSAYYPMDEGNGNVLTDKANGATLYLHGAGWILPNGLSLHFNEGDVIELDQDKFARSAIQDFSLLFWFKTSTNAPILRAGFSKDSTSYSGTGISIENGDLVFRHNDIVQTIVGPFNDDAWHQYILSVNRTYNTVSIFVDGKLTNSFSATDMGAFSGKMLLGGQTEDGGFAGNIDEIVLLEQALPSSMISHFYKMAAEGDEMGIIALLSFEEEYEDENGVIEIRFSPNDQRVFRDSQGNIINKIVPLIREADRAKAETMADKRIYAPVQERGLLTKLNFDWAFNHDELVINLNMADREINKQTIRLTVRNVEDLNGNRMVSPVMWTAFVDRNQLKWEERRKSITLKYGAEEDYILPVSIKNIGGNSHQYVIESLPSWLKVDQESGTIGPLDEKQIKLTVNADMSVGTYSDMIYLTDENDLTEALCIELNIEAMPPYDGVDENKYPYNMSLCGVVKLTSGNEQIYDTDERDIVYAIYNNECVGMANITYETLTNQSEVFITVHGNESMNSKAIRFQLWQASTGRLYELSTDQNILFSHGFVYGCGNQEPVQLVTGGSEVQRIDLYKGWNWVSVNLDLTRSGGVLSKCMTSAQGWEDGDEIKNALQREFSDYDKEADAFVGSLEKLHYSQMYMVKVATDNVMRISGETLKEDSMHITVRGDGLWSSMPCLYDKVTPLAEAFADYYDKASVGDIIKAHNRFATFSKNNKWVGDLESIRPGEGYLFRRMAHESAEINFYKQSASHVSKRSQAMRTNQPEFSNPKASSNMTMIARVEGITVSEDLLEVFVGDELSAVATPILVDEEPLYFLTIQSDKSGTLRFEMNGKTLKVEEGAIRYAANAHSGSLVAPVLLRPAESDRPYKVIENNHIVIIRNNEKYDITGKKL